MDGEYLATGFRNVDGAQDPGAYFDCLTLLDSLPYYREYKTRSYELLDLHPGHTVLEAGCGLGDDAFRMAERIAPGGKVVGVDASAAMISRAVSRNLAARLPVEFMVGDIKSLPFPDNSFARCRIDRVLQHIREPQRAIAELVRVLKPGGLLLAYDNDWATFTIASEMAEMARVVEQRWRGSFANGSIGRELPELFRVAGLLEVAVHPGTCVLAEFETADKVYNLRATMQKTVEERLISAPQGCAWLEEQVGRSAKGCFSASLTAYAVIGRKY